MSDFSSTEKINASWKHLFGILGTNNSSPGKSWYEESIASSHIVTNTEIWGDNVLYATSKALAQTASPLIVEDRTFGESITLVANGSNWSFTSFSITPKIGFQITNTHPNPTYIKSITNVINHGGGSYTVTLNNNSGVFAGSAVLHSRIYLTLDPASNGLAWFSRSIYGNAFSNRMTDFIQSTRFGQGYAIRLFQANGTEIPTTQGAWILNWQQGVLLFASGFTPNTLGYTTPLYIEGFRYVGRLGVGAALPIGNINDTMRFDGVNWVTNGVLQSDGIDVSVLNKLTVSGSLILPSGNIPGSPSTSGSFGEIRYDNNFVYINTGTGWGRASLSRSW